MKILSEIHIKTEFVKNWGIQPCYHFYDSSLENDNLGLKTKFFKFLGIHPNNTVFLPVFLLFKLNSKSTNRWKPALYDEIRQFLLRQFNSRKLESI